MNTVYSPATRLGLRLAFVAAAAMIFTAGCGSPDPTSALMKANEKNIQKLSNLYFTYQMKNGWRGPENETDFKSFLNNYNPKKLERIGITTADVDGLFVSERDGEPFKIRYGVPGSAMGSTAPVVFESVGVGGKRLVGCLNMEQKEVDESEYDRLWNERSRVDTGPRTAAGNI